MVSNIFSNTLSLTTHILKNIPNSCDTVGTGTITVSHSFKHNACDLKNLVYKNIMYNFVYRLVFVCNVYLESMSMYYLVIVITLSFYLFGTIP